MCGKGVGLFSQIVCVRSLLETVRKVWIELCYVRNCYWVIEDEPMLDEKCAGQLWGLC